VPAFAGGHSQVLKVESPGEVTLVYIPDVIPEQCYGERVAVDLSDSLLKLEARGPGPDEGPEQNGAIGNAQVLEVQLGHCRCLSCI
jgi:hypothetical protein